MNTIEAFKLAGEGAKIRGTEWDKGEFVHWDGYKFVDENGTQADPCTNIEWEEYIETVTLREALHALADGHKIRHESTPTAAGIYIKDSGCLETHCNFHLLIDHSKGWTIL